MAEKNIPQVMLDPEMERAKAWWQEHGKAIVAGIVIGLVAVVGINYWQQYKDTQAENASVLFGQLQNVLEADALAKAEADDEAEAESAEKAEGADENTAEIAAKSAETAAKSAETAEKVKSITEQLLSDYGSTPYGVHGAFAWAKFLVESDNLDGAAEALQWILDNADDSSFLHVARLRLGAVLLAQGKADVALTLLDPTDAAAFTYRYHELAGDAYLQKGDTIEANSAYRRSLTGLAPNAPERAVIQLKLDAIGG